MTVQVLGCTLECGYNRRGCTPEATRHQSALGASRGMRLRHESDRARVHWTQPESAGRSRSLLDAAGVCWTRFCRRDAAEQCSDALPPRLHNRCKAGGGASLDPVGEGGWGGRQPSGIVDGGRRRLAGLSPPGPRLLIPGLRLHPAPLRGRRFRPGGCRRRALAEARGGVRSGAYTLRARARLRVSNGAIERMNK